MKLIAVALLALSGSSSFAADSCLVTKSTELLSALSSEYKQDDTAEGRRNILQVASVLCSSTRKIPVSCLVTRATETLAALSAEYKQDEAAEGRRNILLIAANLCLKP